MTVWSSWAHRSSKETSKAILSCIDLRLQKALSRTPALDSSHFLEYFFSCSSLSFSYVAEADAEERAKALNMMRMLANRQNTRWLEAKEWDMPYTFDATKFPTLLGTHQHLTLPHQQHALPSPAALHLVLTYQVITALVFPIGSVTVYTAIVHCTALHHSVVYYTVLYCTVLY